MFKLVLHTDRSITSTASSMRICCLVIICSLVARWIFTFVASGCFDFRRSSILCKDLTDTADASATLSLQSRAYRSIIQLSVNLITRIALRREEKKRGKGNLGRFDLRFPPRSITSIIVMSIRVVFSPEIRWPFGTLFVDIGAVVVLAQLSFLLRIVSLLRNPIDTIDWHSSLPLSFHIFRLIPLSLVVYVGACDRSITCARRFESRDFVRVCYLIDCV